MRTRNRPLAVQVAVDTEGQFAGAEARDDRCELLVRVGVVAIQLQVAHGARDAEVVDDRRKRLQPVGGTSVGWLHPVRLSGETGCNQ